MQAQRHAAARARTGRSGGGAAGAGVGVRVLAEPLPQHLNLASDGLRRVRRSGRISVAGAVGEAMSIELGVGRKSARSGDCSGADLKSAENGGKTRECGLLGIIQRNL